MDNDRTRAEEETSRGIGQFWGRDMMIRKDKSRRTDKGIRPFYLKRIPRSYRLEARGCFQYVDFLVICVKYFPVSLLRLKKMDYFWEYMLQMKDDPAYPAELEIAEEFFDRVVTDVFDEYDFGYAVREGGEESYEPIQSVDFKRNHVYDKWFRMVLVVERHFSFLPFGKHKDNDKPCCIYANDKKLKTYAKLEAVIRDWLSRLKKETDPLKNR